MPFTLILMRGVHIHMRNVSEVPVNLSSVFLVLGTLFLLSGWASAITIVPAAGSIPGSPDSILVAELIPGHRNFTTAASALSSVNFTVRGRVLDAANPTGEFDPGSVNVTATIASTNASSSQVTTNNGFSFNITLPVQESIANNTAGYEVYITTNTTNPAHNKTLYAYRSNATNVSFAFIGSFPPFARSRNFTVDISYFNASNAIASGKPLVEVFQLNGIRQSWVLTNLSDTTNAQGVIRYNVTVPADASGQYALVVDKGAGFLAFGIQSAYKLFAKTETPSGALRTEFSTNAAINLVGAVRNADGTPYALGAGDSASAFVTLPNGSIVSTALAARDSVNLPGIINSTFSQTDLLGQYRLRIVATVAGTEYESSANFFVNPMRARLSVANSFFAEFGDERVIVPNATLDFTVLAYNNSDESIIPGTANGGFNVLNCSTGTPGNLSFLGFTNLLTGANVTNYAQFTAGLPAFSVVAYTPTLNTCKFRVNVPNVAGVYRVDLNVTAPPVMGGGSQVASTIIRVSTVGLDVNPIQVGGSFDNGEFSFNVPPAQNGTFQIRAYNFSLGEQFNSNAIQNVTVLSIKPMVFTGGVSDAYLNFSENNSGACAPCGNRPNPAVPFYWSRPNTQDARLIVTMPDDTGFFEMEVQANVSGEFVTDKVFFEMKVIDGFAGPASIGGQGGPGNGEGQGGGQSEFSGLANCSRGNVTFSAFGVRDVKTNQFAQGVRVNSNVLLAMNHESGRSIAPFLSVPLLNSTNNQGQMTFNVSISQDLPSGFYFILFNATYQGRDDKIYGTLNCQSAGSRMSVRNPAFGQYRPDVDVGPLNFSGFTTFGPGGSQQIVNGTLEITSIRLFNRDAGGEQVILPNASQGPQRVNLSSGSALILLSPSNFSLAQFPQGFLQFSVNITNGSQPGPLFNEGPSWIVGNDFSTFAGGAEIRAYELSVVSQPPVGGFAQGQVASIRLNASTNVSQSGQNFTVEFQKFGFGSGGAGSRATIQSAVLEIDAWNESTDFDWEQWNVTFVVPTSLRAGEYILKVVANNSKGIQVSANSFTSVSGFTVQTLVQDNLFMEGIMCEAFDNANENGSFQGCVNFGAPGTFSYENGTHMNLSLLNTTYSVISKSGFVCLKREFNFTQYVQNQDPVGGPSIVFDQGSHLVVIDNTTPERYDTLVVNTSNGTQQIISVNNFTSLHRRLVGNTTKPYPDYYLANIFNCGHLSLVNGTVEPLQDQGGQGAAPSVGNNFVNDKWYAPHRVTRASAPLSANVSHVGYASMACMGPGYCSPVGELPSTNYSTGATLSDANGVAFVEVNITVNGNYMAIWDVNATIDGQTVTERAKTRSDNRRSGGGGVGTSFDVVSFRSCKEAMIARPSVDSANANLTLSQCSIRDKAFTSISGAKLSINLVTGSPHYGLTRVPATISDAGTGAIDADGLWQTGGMPSSFNFTHPSGWPCNEGFMIELNVTNSSVTQLAPLDYFYRSCSDSGGGGS